MSGELFKTMAGVDLVHVPYKGSTAAHGDLIAGRVALMFDTVAAIAGQIKGGNVRALAVTTATRSAALPDLPTMAEAGMKGYETSTWGGLLAPAGTPKDVVARLNAEANKALAAPDVREKLAAAGIEPAGGTAAQFAPSSRAKCPLGQGRRSRRRASPSDGPPAAAKRRFSCQTSYLKNDHLAIGQMIDPRSPLESSHENHCHHCC